MTEQQVPMLMRLIMLMFALHQKQIKSSTDISELSVGSDNEDDSMVPDKSWTGWIWRAATSILPEEEESDGYSDQQCAYKGHTLHTGCYIDHASFTFKVMCTYI